MADVALFTPTFEYAGGVERYIINLSKGLNERGYSVEIVTGNPDGPFSDGIPAEVQIKQINIPPLPMVGVLSSAIPLINYFRSADPDNFISAMNQVNIPCIIAHQIAHSDSNLIITDHNNPKVLLSDKNPERMKDKLIYTMAKRLYPLADEIVGVSDGVASDLADVIGVSNETVRSIYNPVVTDKIREDASVTPDQGPFKEDIPVILGVKPETQKNHTLLVRAFDRVLDQTAAHLVIVGEGDQMKEVKELVSDLEIKEHVDILGYVDNIYPYLGNADVFASSSRWEGLPTIHIEALACGTMVVSTDCPSGPREILQGGKYGVLTPTGDPENFADALIQGLESPIEPNILRNRADDFTIENAAMEYQNIIK